MSFSPWVTVSWSPWPFFSGLSLFMIPLGLVLWVTYGSTYFFFFASVMVAAWAFFWFSDVSLEGELGTHTTPVVATLIGGVALFITSEAALFFSLFWSTAHTGVIPSVFAGGTLPSSFCLISPFSLPVFNLITLLWSSATVNLAHGYLRVGNRTMALFWSFFTIVLGFFFVFAQYVEYSSASLAIADGAFLSSFYLTTGVHGSHVLAGLGILMTNSFRLVFFKAPPSLNISWSAGLWYWHFVDLIWVIVWSLIYLWPSI